MTLVPDWLGSQDSRFWSVMARLAAITGLIFPIAAVASFFLTSSPTTPTLILAIYVCILATTLIVLLIKQENRYIDQVKQYQAEYINEVKAYQAKLDVAHREMRYGPAAMPMRRAFAKVANATWHLVQGESSQAAFRIHMQESLRYFSEAFTLITGATCRSSIKLIAAPLAGTHKNDITVSTFCRNDDEPEETRHAPDRIGDNTDFKQIFEEAAANFFCNDLPARLSKGYRNSHWDEHTIEAGTFGYRATIVWPIGRSGDIGFESGNVPEIIGFLCVDTFETNVFHQTYDVALGSAFSHALHLALYRFRDLISQRAK